MTTVQYRRYEQTTRQSGAAVATRQLSQILLECGLVHQKMRKEVKLKDPEEHIDLKNCAYFAGRVRKELGIPIHFGRKIMGLSIGHVAIGRMLFKAMQVKRKEATLLIRYKFIQFFAEKLQNQHRHSKV